MIIPFKYALTDLYGFFLVLTRLIGLFSVSPIFSQKEIIPQAKMSLVVTLAIFIYPIVQTRLPRVDGHIMLFAHFFFLEFLIGFFLGLICKAFFMTLEFLGTIIGIQSGLSNAMIFNPALGTQTVLPAVFLTLAGAMLLFTTNLHHSILSGLVHSYFIFDISNPNLLQDIDASVLNTMSRLCTVGLQFAFPFIIVGLILNFSLGLINKVVPQIQVFQTIMSSQVGVGLVVMAATITGILWGFTEFYKTEITRFFKLV